LAKRFEILLAEGEQKWKDLKYVPVPSLVHNKGELAISYVDSQIWHAVNHFVFRPDPEIPMEKIVNPSPLQADQVASQNPFDSKRTPKHHLSHASHEQGGTNVAVLCHLYMKVCISLRGGFM
jgi:hypothetical protein